MCGATHHDLFGYVLTSDNEVRRRIVYTLDDTIVLFYWMLYDIMWLVDL